MRTHYDTQRIDTKHLKAMQQASVFEALLEMANYADEQVYGRPTSPSKTSRGLRAARFLEGRADGAKSTFSRGTPHKIGA